MNANQLTNALVDAAAAAKPAQEYCLLGIDWWATCMTKAEWSGWMQAIGAVLALATAIALPYVQARATRRSNYLMAKSCIMNLIGVLYAIQTTSSVGNVRDAYASASESFATLLLTCQEVRSSDLPKGSLPTWHAVRTQALQLESETTNIGHAQGYDDFWRGQIEKHIRVALKLLEDFTKLNPS